MNWPTLLGLVCLTASLVTSRPTFSQQSANDKATATAAVVNGQSISVNTVHHFLDRSFRNLPNLANRADRAADVVQAGIEHCINREVILQHLQSGKFKTSDQEIDRQLEEFEAQLKRTGSTLEKHLEEIQLTTEELRRERLWQTSWRKYAQKFVTIEHLKKQFEQKRKYFDGTKLHVAQILLKDNRDETVEKARTILKELETKKLSWNDAVKAHSESASAKNKGDLGWIDYSGPMPRTFTQQAFELEAGEFSQPFTSKYGVHVVRCIEVVDGTKTFDDVAQELRDVETNRLFQLVSQRHRPKAKIETPALDARPAR